MVCGVDNVKLVMWLWSVLSVSVYVYDESVIQVREQQAIFTIPNRVKSKRIKSDRHRTIPLKFSSSSS